MIRAMSFRCLVAALIAPSVNRQLLAESIEGDAAAVAELIRAGADVNTSFRGWTPLHYAALRGHREVASVLLAAGADPSRVTHRGDSPRVIANNIRHFDVSLLLAAAEGPRVS
jgi:ankyrin repeat protein